MHLIQRKYPAEISLLFTSKTEANHQSNNDEGGDVHTESERKKNEKWQVCQLLLKLFPHGWLFLSGCFVQRMTISTRESERIQR